MARAELAHDNIAVSLVVPAVVVLAAVLSNRISERLRVPAPFLFLVCAAAAAQLVPSLHRWVPISLV